jgi:hypothetical protein
MVRSGLRPSDGGVVGVAFSGKERGWAILKICKNDGFS